uniref:Zgc:113425 n=1 Tax=Lepisosteus oculatus TaxID=7918 RepID=W5MWY7_LEPOC
PRMDRYRYFIFNQRSMVVLGILQIACAGLCVVCGFMDAAFRKDTTLSHTRAPLWAGVVMAIPGVLALFSSQRKNPVLVNAMIAVSVFSCFTTIIIVVYSSLTLSYGEDDDELFHPDHIHTPQTKFILSKIVKGANITMLLACSFSIVLALFTAFLGCRSLPYCACYDSVTGLETLVSQDDQNPQTELICTWQAHGDDRLFNAPVQFSDRTVEQEEEEMSSKPPPYIRLA